MKAPSLLLAALVLVACSEPSVVAPRPVARTAKSGLEVRVLDPGGRIYHHPRDPEVFLRDPATGEIHRGPRFREVPEGAEIVVAAPGCAEAVVPAERSGIQYVRLSPGIPVVLSFHDPTPLPDRIGMIGLEATAKPDREGWWSEVIDEWRAVDAGWLEDDLVTHRDHASLTRSQTHVRLYVPGPGRYHVTWNTTTGNSGGSWPADLDFEVAAGGAESTFELSWPWDEDGKARRR